MLNAPNRHIASDDTTGRSFSFFAAPGSSPEELLALAEIIAGGWISGGEFPRLQNWRSPDTYQVLDPQWRAVIRPAPDRTWTIWSEVDRSGKSERNVMTATKNDRGKPRFDLVPVALARAFDAPESYGDHPSPIRLVESLLRGQTKMKPSMMMLLENILSKVVDAATAGTESKRIAAEGLVAAVLTHVVESGEYPPNDWKGGMSFTRLANSILRHLRSHRNGDILDSDTRLPHLAHAMCGICFLMHFVGDMDRYGKFNDLGSA